MLFNFQAFIEELRKNPQKREIIEKYEKYVLNGNIISGDIKDQKWYKDYLFKFNKLPAYKIPEDHKDDFDWGVLFQLIAGSYSSTYRLTYQSASEEGKTILPDLLIKVKSGDQTIEKAVSELWSFQIRRLFEIYILEQIQMETVHHENNDSKEKDQILHHEREQIFKSYQRLFDPPKPRKKKRHKEPRKKVWAHYCSLESAYHILGKGMMFASDLSYMNDTSELTFGIDVLMSALKKIAEKKRLPSGFRKWLQQIINNDTQLRSSLEQAPVYISCFCSEEDTLNQWRAYGDNGKGVCIVFDFNKTLNELGEGLSDGFIMDDVKYLSLDDNHRKKEWKKVIKDIEEQFRDIYYESNNANASIEQIFNYLTPRLRRLIRFCKNDKFSEEKERRQVCLNIEDDDFGKRNKRANYKLHEVKNRLRKEYVIPYIDLKVFNIYGESAITKIIIGPSVTDFDKTKRSFERFINELNKKKSIDQINKLYREGVSPLLPIKSTVFSHSKTLHDSIGEKNLIIEPTREKVLDKAKSAFNKFLSDIYETIDEVEYQQLEAFIEKGFKSIETHIYIQLYKSNEQITSPNEDRSIIQKSTIPYLP